MKRIIKTKAIRILICIVTLLSLVSIMSLTAFADTTYGAYVPSANDDEDVLADKVVKFGGIDWYLIKDESTAEDSGSVILLAKDPIAGLKFNEKDDGYAYSNSLIRTYLDNLTAEGGAFADVARAIKSVDLEDANVTGAKFYLLSKSEAEEMIPTNVGKCNKHEDAETNFWWLRSPSKIAASYMPAADGVSGDNGKITLYGGIVEFPYNVRPALQLDLSKVIFNADTKEFTLPQYDIVAVDGLSGKDKKEWTKETKDGVTITVKLAGEDKSFEHFTGVKLDGKDLVKDKDYTVKKGGTIVTLTPKTLEKLSVGEHVVTILFDNGEANTAITILEKKPVEIVKSPKTGDNNNILIWTILVSAVIITATATNLFGEKRFNR